MLCVCVCAHARVFNWYICLFQILYSYSFGVFLSYISDVKMPG